MLCTVFSLGLHCYDPARADFVETEYIPLQYTEYHAYPDCLLLSLWPLVASSVSGSQRHLSLDTQLLVASFPAPDHIWVQTRHPVTLSEISRLLRVAPATMARLNGVDPEHRFRQGDWLVVPAKQLRAAGQLAALDTRDARRTPPPPLAPPPLPTKGVVKLGDTLFTIAQRYGMSMQEVLRLNPGLDTTRLVAGTEIELVFAPPRPRAMLGLRPHTSGGLKMPEAPQPQPASPPQPIAPEPLRFDQSLDELVRQGVVSPAERQRIRATAKPTPQQSSAQLEACNSGKLSMEECSTGVVVRLRGNTIPQAPLPSALSTLPQAIPSHHLVGPTSKPLSARELALLQRIRSDGQLPQWRTYGQCKYDWAGWKLHSNGSRTTAAECSGTEKRLTIGVSCERLLVAIRTAESGWSNWERPAGPDNKTRRGEDEMVASLCANAVTDP
jgi:LysM repeat protein